MRGQVILLTALMIAVAVSAVLILQSAAASAPGFGGVRAAYGVFSRDVSKAVEAVTSYLDYVGAVLLINFTENTASYALPASVYGLMYGYGDVYCSWRHMNNTISMFNVSMLFFFVANRAPLGLSVELPRHNPTAQCNTLQFTSAGGLSRVAFVLSPAPNGTLKARPVSATNFDAGLTNPVAELDLVLPRASAYVCYRLSMVMNVSLLALMGLNVTKEFWISAWALHAVDGNCPAGSICVNITTRRPYIWTAEVFVLNRTVSGYPLNVTYALARLREVSLVNYTAYSAVYRITPDGRLVEPVVKLYVANVPMYLSGGRAEWACQQSGGYSAVVNVGNTPIVLANTTAVSILYAPSAYRNVTKATYQVGNMLATYYVIHRNGYLNFTLNFCNAPDVKAALRNNGLWWVYP
ncbi:MAG: hypothetical protein ACO2PM_24535 [Pyrobaculum sp.]|jgi:hypothetical protein